jgi:hypothetical protein
MAYARRSHSSSGVYVLATASRESASLPSPRDISNTPARYIATTTAIPMPVYRTIVPVRLPAVCDLLCTEDFITNNSMWAGFIQYLHSTGEKHVKKYGTGFVQNTFAWERMQGGKQQGEK